MNKKQLKLISYIYLILPIIVFMIGWVKLVFAIVPIICLFVIIYRKFIEKSEEEKFISKKMILIIFLLTILICMLGGIGGFFYQNNDWHCRNAIFRDLINIDWPVYYQDSDYALTYYIGIWMIPAIIR